MGPIVSKTTFKYYMKQHHGENNNPKDEKQQAIQDTWRKFIADCETNQPEDQCLSILFRTGCKGFDFQQCSRTPWGHNPRPGKSQRNNENF